ncbi:Oxysterol-binding protein-domain-containing protein [Myxozyma melibiosi]|uniref:Oxysterol-binding protein-domain-containing protein n=1 Tax=Myxozyma melibiosi TaxID=54550 RepID=A0ABR1FAL0_9ASCO
METLEIHSKDFVVKWISVPDNGSVRWQIRPNKKSINFGIFRRLPGASDSTTALAPNAGSNPAAAAAAAGRTRSSSSVTVISPTGTTHGTAPAGTLHERLRNSGLTPVYWHGKCHAHSILKGSYHVPKNSGGMFAFVFDNTFSKTLSKTVQFAHSIESQDATYSEGMTATTTMAAPKRRRSTAHHPSTKGNRNSVLASQSQPSPPVPPTILHTHSDNSVPNLATQRAVSASSSTLVPQTGVDDRFHSGILLKKRRKKLQGYAKRYFTLDCDSGMLSYYHDASSSLLRGSIPLAIAAVAVKPMTREIFIDSGAEIFNLRAQTQHDFVSWKDALERARTRALVTTTSASSAIAGSPTESGKLSPITSAGTQLLSPPSPGTVMLTDKEWARLEEIGDKINAALKLTREMGGEPSSPSGHPNHHSHIPNPLHHSLHHNHHSNSHNNSNSNSHNGAKVSPQPQAHREDYFALDAMVEQLHNTSVAPQTSATTPGGTTTTSSRKFWKKRSSTKDSSNNAVTPGGGDTAAAHHHHHQQHHNKDVAIEVLQNLLTTANEDFVAIMNAPRRRSFSGFRMPNLSSVRRGSLDVASIYSDSEFFDAEEGPAIVVIADNDEPVEDIVVVSDEEEEEETARSSSSSRRRSSSSSSSSVDADHRLAALSPSTSAAGATRDLSPLPIEKHIERRHTVPANSVLPPSLIQFVRKNVGKDLSTIAMPVTANEPLSALQRYAEAMEYSSLIDAAAAAKVDSGEQMMYIAAFAISNLSNMRCNTRALRKPFNPLMNETFEMVREDRGIRFIAEKISHRPPIFATFAETPKWTYSYCPQPAQKFWGKSAELISEGPITISVLTTEDGAERTITYSYAMPTTYLRNILAGEKYVEPSGQMHISSSSGHKASIEFKSKSMFSGQKSDEVFVKIFGPQNKPLPEVAISGKWTTSLTRTSDGKCVWSVGNLLPEPRLRYGMPEFCAELNDITEIEREKMAPTDSRLRPDQRLLETGQIEQAEEVKKKLEDSQRERRKQGKIPAEGVASLWFTKAENGVWIPIQGAGGYWEQRRVGDWEKCPPLW